MLSLPASDEQPTHEPISSRHGDARAKSFGHQFLVARVPDQSEQESHGQVPDAPDPHQREVQFLCDRIGVQWETQGLEVCVGSKHGVDPEEEREDAQCEACVVEEWV